MGLDLSSINFHCHLKKNGVRFDRVAMLGRHTFFGVSATDIEGAARKHGLEIPPGKAEEMLRKNQGYIEPFYEWLGATEVHSFDASDYEKATHLWDMNDAVPAEHQGGYDLVFDGGTLEHVFHYPTALREAMTLPRIDGLFLSATPANSYLGHGFYQFSPDLPFEILTPPNGYANEGVYLVEERLRTAFYQVSDPRERRGRVLASSAWPTIMYFVGRRTGEVPSRLSASQPDYVSAWESGDHQERPDEGWKAMIGSALDWMPMRFRNSILRLGKILLAWISGSSFNGQSSLRRRPEI